MTANVAEIMDHLRQNPAADWTDPDWSLIDDGLPPAPDLPLPLLRSWAPWIADYAAMKSAPVGYALGSVLAACGAAIGSARMVEARPGWRAYPALWVLLVGSPSALKSPVLGPVLALLEDIEREEATDFDAVRRAHETKRETAKALSATWEAEVRTAAKAGNSAPLKPVDADTPDEPKPPRIVLKDPTIEAAAPVLKANPRGVLVARDELAGFLGNLNKYGGDGDAAFWLERYDGTAFSTDRVKSGHVQGHIGLASMLGGIQPDRVQELLLSRPDDGFVSRFLMIYPAPVARVWVTPVADLDTLKRALTRLRALAPNMENDRIKPVIVRLKGDAAHLFEKWWIENGEDGNASVGFRAGMLGKAPGVVLRLALILELIEWAGSDRPEPKSVSRESVAAAIALFEDYLLPSACRVIGGAARDKGDAAAAFLLKQIRLRRAGTVNAKSIYRGWRLPGLASAKPVNAALDALCDGGWVRRTRDPRPGRPAGDWEVNPLLWDSGS